MRRLFYVAFGATVGIIVSTTGDEGRIQVDPRRAWPDRRVTSAPG